MKRQVLFLLIAVVLFSYVNSSHAQTWQEVPYDSVEMEAAWEPGYQHRVNLLLDAESTWSWGILGDSDNGKRYWSALLARMYKAWGDTAALNTLIREDGHAGIFSNYHESDFYKPFTCPGYSFYYFKYKDTIQQVDPDQITEIESTWDNENRAYTSRKDGQMDPIYNCTEFNSENFDWMARTAGFLFAHEYDDNTIISDGDKPAMEYYADWVNNWLRGTYCAGRVEWASHVYSGFCLQAAATIFELSDDPVKREQARAVMDWMAMEQAIRYIDGHLVGPESRNKDGGIIRFNGSIWPYAYLWFVDDAHHPEMTEHEVADHYTNDAGLWTCGFIPHLSYRPPKAIVDIAQRKFSMPVEMHNTKPYYRLDWDNYADWDGQAENSRKFEFETVYLHDQYTLASSATNRPAKTGPFVEYCVWRLGVKDLAVQVFGNTGYNSTISGRSPYEEVAQYRNSMMRIMKGTDKMWLAVPDTAMVIEWQQDILFAKLTDHVYIAAVPYNATGHQQADFTMSNQHFQKLTWEFNSSNLNGLVLEVGTLSEHGSYSDFKNDVNNNAQVSSPQSDRLSYLSTLGNTFTMEWVPTTTYDYMTNSCYISTVDPAGDLPEIWYEGVKNDFSKWESYEVVHGDPIVDSKWSDGTLEVRSDDHQMRIVVDTSTAEVSWQLLSDVTGIYPGGNKQQQRVANLSVKPNPAKGSFEISCKSPVDINENTSDVWLFDLTGKKVKHLISKKDFIGQEKVNKKISIPDLNPGIYFINDPTGHQVVKVSVL